MPWASIYMDSEQLMISVHSSQDGLVGAGIWIAYVNVLPLRSFRSRSTGAL